MPQTANPEVQKILDASKAPDAVKAKAWDAFFGSDNPQAFKKSFDRLLIPQEAKEQLWDLKFGKVGMPEASSDVSGNVLRRRAQVGKVVPGEKGSLGQFGKGVEEGEGEGVLGHVGNIARGGIIGAKGMAFDLPRTLWKSGADKPSKEEQKTGFKHRGPALAAKRLLFDPQKQEYDKSKEAAEEGKTIESMGHSAAASIPIIGPMAGYFGEKVGQGKWDEALGESFVYWLGGKAGKKIARELKPEQRLSAATGGSPEDLKKVMPELAKTAKKPPKTVGEMEGVIKETGKRLETEFNLALQPYRGQTMVPMDVATELMKKANQPNLAKTAEGRLERAALRRASIDFQRPWTVEELNLERMRRFNHRVEGKTQVGQMQAVRSNVDTAIDKIVEDKLRDIVYGLDPKFKPLKEVQSRLIKIQETLEKQVENLSKQQAEYQTMPLTKRLGMSMSGHAGGITPRVHGLMPGAGPEDLANKQVKRGFPTLKNKAKDLGQKARIQAVRNWPIAALFEETNEDDNKKSLPPLK